MSASLSSDAGKSGCRKVTIHSGAVLQRHKSEDKSQVIVAELLFSQPRREIDDVFVQMHTDPLQHDDEVNARLDVPKPAGHQQ
jgi:hypothetical protein